MAEKVFFVNKLNARLSICLCWVIGTAALGIGIWEAADDPKVQGSVSYSFASAVF